MPETEITNRQSRPQVGQSQAQKENKTRIHRPMLCKVFLLSGEEYEVSVDKRAVGQVLFQNVCEFLGLVEQDYFGLLYRKNENNENVRYWLDPAKKISDQMKGGKRRLEFALKFYPPDPTQLIDSVSRFLVCQQIRQDIVSGRLPCSQETQAILGSYTVQAEIGDYDPLDHGKGIGYIRDILFSQDQTDDLLYKIAELHKQHKGQTPEQAEQHYLEYSRKIALYGIDLHRAKDSNYVDILLGIGSTGVSVYRDNVRINRFVWPKILKISYRRNKFLLRIRPAEFETFESWIAFRLPNNRMAKRLWKIAVENHSFLRLRSAEDAKKRSGFPTFGSKFRFSGRTLHQTRLYASMAYHPSKRVEKTHSRESLNSLPDNKMRNVNNSVKKSEDVNGNQSYVSKDSHSEKEGPASKQNTLSDVATPFDVMDKARNGRETDSESAHSSGVTMESVDLREDEPQMRTKPEAALNHGKQRLSSVGKDYEKIFESGEPLKTNKPEKRPSSETSSKDLKQSNRKSSKKNKENEREAVQEFFM